MRPPLIEQEARDLRGVALQLNGTIAQRNGVVAAASHRIPEVLGLGEQTPVGIAIHRDREHRSGAG
ncbi:MAG: hypothetical protein HOH95_14875 [Dehalococcoidia bacterium]|nr:hypothetical protein [Dehalococcoidia bacterium]